MTEIRQILLQFPSLRAFLAEYGARISAEGMLLRVASPPAAGSTVDVEVVVAEGMRLLRARGETLWRGPAGPDGGQAAVRFRELDDAGRTVIDRIVEQRRREGAETFNLGAVRGSRESRLRDLTIPAAMPGTRPEAPDRQTGGPVFDLAAPPETPAAVEAPPAAADEASASRRPAPPVPLLADPEVVPFDLEPPRTAAEGEPGVAGIEPPEAGTEVAAPGDLSELFGGDGPETAPAPGRTEAFPPSFLDEVEAELEAAGGSEAASAYSVVDTGELEVRLGAPLDEDVSEVPAEPMIEVEAEPTLEASGPGAEAVPGASAEAEAEARVGAEAASGRASQAEAALPVKPPVEAEAPSEIADEAPEAAETTGVVAAAPEGEAQVEQAPESEDGAAAPPTPALDAETLAPEASLEVADAFAAEHGPETVEIPIVDPPPPAEAVAKPPTPVVEPPPVVASTPPAVEPPAAAEPASPAPIDDNLLSIPEFNAGSGGSQAPAPEPPAELPSSAQALRGAASRSRHVGTWMLIALLIGALGVAGYLLMGLMRGGEGSPDASSARPTRAPEAVRPERPTGPAPAESPQSGAEPEQSAVDETPAAGGAGDTPPAPAPAAAGPPPPAAEPGDVAAPLTGLNRITWTETDSETILALVGDGEISRQRIETVSIGGAQPRLVVKIGGVERAFQPAVLEVGTAHVQRVRIGLQAGGELHVVVDLADEGVFMRDLAAAGARVELRLAAE